MYKSFLKITIEIFRKNSWRNLFKEKFETLKKVIFKINLHVMS